MFLRTNYNPEIEKIKKIRYVKGSKSVDKMISSKKMNLSKMDEKLSLLNSDIEDLYKKYAEKKKIRRKKEKSEQNLVSRINFLIDEERKIRTIIENTPIQKDNNKLKNKSSSPETITNPGTIRYKTIESNDGNHRSGIYRFKNISRKNEKKNLKNNELEIGIKENDEKDGKNINSTLSSRNSEKININEHLNYHDDKNEINNNNINIPSSSNVTNNVCIIINNTEQNSSIQNSSHKYNNNYFQEEVSFSKKDKNNQSSNSNINTSDINITNSEVDKRKISLEIQNIKLKLASKIKNEEKENFSENNEENYLNTPSFNKKIIKEKGNKDGIRSLKDMLKIKRNILKNLNREIDLKKISINIKKKSVENRKRNILFSINLNTENFYDKNTLKKTCEDKLINKRSFSKPDNIIYKKRNINKKNKSNSSNKIAISSKIEKHSIDSNEYNIKETKIKSNNNENKKHLIKENNSRNKKQINLKNNEKIDKKPKNIIQKINDIPSSPKNVIPLSYLSFNQSIENKRKMLGLGINFHKNKGKQEQKGIINPKSNDNDFNKPYFQHQEKKQNMIKSTNNEIDNSKSENNNEDINSYDITSYPSISNATNPLDNNINKNNFNLNNIKYNFSLMSIFSDKSSRTNIPHGVIKKRIQNNNDNNEAKIIKIKNLENNDIILKKQEKNKNYVNSIRIIKKREKNNIKKNENENQINNENKNYNNPIKYIDRKESENDLKEKKPKIYENKLTIAKELAVIRRINMKIEEYKNYRPQIQKISQRRKNRFQEEKNINNDVDIIDEKDMKKNKSLNSSNSSINNNKNKGKKYRFQSHRRLSEIQKRTNSSFGQKNNLVQENKNRIRSKNNKSFNKVQNNNIRLLKFS